ncbi:MAG TPA: hypothetical protein VFA26_19800, partial [Gemmataceae bacterium]|nr:hypothetical protein [Gemmataceae bacterium]
TQVGRIVETIRYYLASVQNSQARPAGGAGQPGRPGVGPGRMPPAGPVVGPLPEELPLPPGYVSPELAPPLNVQGSPSQPQVINLIRVPTTQQVLLKVRVAELNRTGIRQIGADWFIGDRDSGSVFGTQIGNGTVSAQGIIGENGGIVTNRNQIRTFFGTSPNTTIFGVFEGPSFETLVRALRRNQLLKILAEPNLVAMNGHQASFLAGGEFPVPIPMTTTGGAGTSVTVTFKEFGVRLGFVPTILDNDTIRLVVDPEVSTIDFSIGVIIVPGGSPVPGLNTRKAHTTVELRQGQTLAMAGLLQVTLDSQTSRIPGLGDLPYIGPLFSNTTGQRTEKELLILVTPYLVEPMNPGQVPPAPGDEVNEPNDLEFYFLNRIEGRTGRDVRSTVNYDDPLHILRCFLKMEKEHVNGPHGFCD